MTDEQKLKEEINTAWCSELQRKRDDENYRKLKPYVEAHKSNISSYDHIYFYSVEQLPIKYINDCGAEVLKTWNTMHNIMGASLWKKGEKIISFEYPIKSKYLLNNVTYYIGKFYGELDNIKINDNVVTAEIDLYTISYERTVLIFDGCVDSIIFKYHKKDRVFKYNEWFTPEMLATIQR